MNLLLRGMIQPLRLPGDACLTSLEGILLMGTDRNRYKITLIVEERCLGIETARK
jgi:hypothetical protein